MKGFLIVVNTAHMIREDWKLNYRKLLSNSLTLITDTTIVLVLSSKGFPHNMGYDITKTLAPIMDIFMGSNHFHPYCCRSCIIQLKLSITSIKGSVCNTRFFKGDLQHT